MNFGFTEEQDFLRESVRKFLDERCPLPQVREWMTTEDAFDRSLWSEMAALGWLGLLVPEEQGGAGLSDFLRRVQDLQAAEAREGEAQGRTPDEGAVQLIEQAGELAQSVQLPSKASP